MGLVKRIINALKLSGTRNTPAVEDIPDITLCLDTTEATSCTVNFSTPDGGRLVILLLAIDALVPSTVVLKSFVDTDSSFYSSYPGVLDVRILQLPRGQSEGPLTFDSLTPSTSYNFFAYLDCTFPDEIPDAATTGAKKKKTKSQKVYCNMPGLIIHNLLGYLLSVQT